MIDLPRFPSFHSSFIYFIWLKKQTKPKACSQLTRTTGILCASKSKLSTPWSCTQTASQVTQHCSSEFIWEVFTAQVIAKESFPKGNCGRAALDGTTLLLGTLQSTSKAQVMNTLQCVSSKKQSNFLWDWHYQSHRKWTLAFFHLHLNQTKPEDHWQLQAGAKHTSRFRV